MSSKIILILKGSAGFDNSANTLQLRKGQTTYATLKNSNNSQLKTI